MSTQQGTGHSADQSSTAADANMKNRQQGDRMSSDRKDDDSDRHANRGLHKGWEQSGRDPASSGSTRY